MLKKILMFPTLGLLLNFTPLTLADYENGVSAAFKGNFEEAFYEFSLAAEDGLDLAQYNLAILYFMGQGVEKDVDLAFKWTEAAAKQGHSAAQYNLGSLYYSGDGTPEDLDEAINWYSKAAESGHPEAAFLLAKMYQEGEGVTADPVQAHAWASMAISRDHQGAGDIRSDIEAGMDSDQLSQAKRLFARWQIN
jgi:TPR repeat protein